MQITWQLLSFEQLTTQHLYDVMKLRVDVFVVEQNCPYPELDDKDHQSGVHHLLGFQDGKLVAYSRLLPAGLSYPSPSIGRIVTHQDHRSGGLGHKLLDKSLQYCRSFWPGENIEIGATQMKIFFGLFFSRPCDEVTIAAGSPYGIRTCDLGLQSRSASCSLVRF